MLTPYWILNFNFNIFKVREQGVGRNKSTLVTILADLEEPGSGGDYHTTYWPMASFLSSRRYHVELTAQTYSGVLKLDLWLQWQSNVNKKVEGNI